MAANQQQEARTVDLSDKRKFDILCDDHQTPIYCLKHGIPIEELYIDLSKPSVLELIHLLEEEVAAKATATASSNNNNNNDSNSNAADDEQQKQSSSVSSSNNNNNSNSIDTDLVVTTASTASTAPKAAVAAPPTTTATTNTTTSNNSLSEATYNNNNNNNSSNDSNEQESSDDQEKSLLLKNDDDNGTILNKTLSHREILNYFNNSKPLSSPSSSSLSISLNNNNNNDTDNNSSSSSSSGNDNDNDFVVVTATTTTTSNNNDNQKARELVGLPTVPSSLLLLSSLRKLFIRHCYYENKNNAFYNDVGCDGRYNSLNDLLVLCSSSRIRYYPNNNNNDVTTTTEEEDFAIDNEKLQQVQNCMKRKMEVENRLYQSIITLLSSSTTDLQCFGIFKQTSTTLNLVLHHHDDTSTTAEKSMSMSLMSLISFIVSILQNHQTTLEHFYYVEQIENEEQYSSIRRYLTKTTLEEWNNNGFSSSSSESESESELEQQQQQQQPISSCCHNKLCNSSTSTKTISSSLLLLYNNNNHSLIFQELSNIVTLQTITIGNHTYNKKIHFGGGGYATQHGFLKVVLKLRSKNDHDHDDDDDVILLPPPWSWEKASIIDSYISGRRPRHNRFGGPPPLLADYHLAIDEIVDGMKLFLLNWRCPNNNNNNILQHLQQRRQGVVSRIDELYFGTSSPKALDVCLERLVTAVTFAAATITTTATSTTTTTTTHSTTGNGGQNMGGNKGSRHIDDRVVLLDRLTLDLVPPSKDFTNLGDGTVVNPPNWYWNDENVMMKICNSLGQNTLPNNDTRSSNQQRDDPMMIVGIKAITIGLYNFKNRNVLDGIHRLAGQGYAVEPSLILDMFRIKQNHFLHDMQVLRGNPKHPTTRKEPFTLSNCFSKPHFRNEIEYQTKLNRIGRGWYNLPSLDNRNAWIDLIINNTNDPEAIYYLLHQNPDTIVKQR